MRSESKSSLNGEAGSKLQIQLLTSTPSVDFEGIQLVSSNPATAHLAFQFISSQRLQDPPDFRNIYISTAFLFLPRLKYKMPDVRLN